MNAPIQNASLTISGICISTDGIEQGDRPNIGTAVLKQF